MLSRYQHVEGTSKVPMLKVPWPESPEDPETIKEHLKAAQTAAVQWSNEAGSSMLDDDHQSVIYHQTNGGM